MTPDTSPEAVAAVYGATRHQLIEQLTAAGADASKKVPSCPEWSITEVMAHLSGLSADVLAGVEGPLGSDEATTRQVGSRSHMSLDEICAEWVGNGDAMATWLIETPLRGLGLTADLAVHVHDLAEMLDGVAPPPTEATRLGCERYVPLLQERAAEQLDLALAVTLDSRAWPSLAASATLTMQGGPSGHTDFLRSVTGRRTRAQAEAAFTWQGDPSTLLDQAFTQYGPFRTAA